MGKPLYEIPTSCDFSKVIGNVVETNECTPRLFDSSFFPFTGILINGPAEVVWPADASVEDHPPGPLGDTAGPLRLMIAGLVKLPYSAMGLNGGFGPEVLVIAVNQETAEVFYGKMDRIELLPVPENVDSELSLTDEDRSAAVSSVFNLDLVHSLGIPIEQATYTVYATLGDFKSNTLTVMTRVE